ncbi:MAG: LTA synthase family protein [Prevotella sp.]
MYRIIYFLKLYVAMIMVFVVQKTIFMLVDAPDGSCYGIADWWQMACNGLYLDIPTTGYLTALPFLALVVTVWVKRNVALRRLATPYYILVSIATGIIFIADMALYPFWNFKLDALALSYLESPQGAFASVSAGFIVLRLLLICIVIASTSWLLLSITPRHIQPVKTRRQRIVLTAAFVAFLPFYVISIRGGIGESTANIGKVYFSDDTFLNHSAVNPTFSLLYSLDKTKDYASEFNYFSEEERKEIISELRREERGERSENSESLKTAQLSNLTPHSSLLTPHSNVLLILMEGFGGQFVEAVSGRTEIAPNYNRLAREGIVFTHCYSNSFRTDRGTVSTLSGYPSFPTLSVMKIPAKSRTLPCIASTLNDNGYTSSFLYGGDINFTNMQSYLRTGGYQTIVSDVDFSASDRKENPWGVNDDITFNRLYDMIMQQKQQPWHICFLTLSSHEPWTVPYKRLKEEIPNAFAFTDHCLGEFVERLRKTPLWDNLLIVCIPDHGYEYPKGISHEEHHRNSMLWIGGAVKEHKVVDTIMNQSDMAATLFGALGIDHSAYQYSRDILSSDYTYPYAFFTFKEGIGFADSTGFSVYDIISDRQLEDHSAVGVKDKKAATTTRIRKAKALLQTFYDDFGNR